MLSLDLKSAVRSVSSSDTGMVHASDLLLGALSAEASDTASDPASVRLLARLAHWGSVSEMLMATAWAQLWRPPSTASSATLSAVMLDSVSAVPSDTV